MIYVFKTSVKTENDIKKLKPCLNELPPQTNWNFDLEDCDKILRIDSQTDVTNYIIDEFKSYGFYCEELSD